MTMRTLLRPVLCALSVLLAAVPVFGWGYTGHMVVAAIAYEDLKPEARAKIDTILKAHKQYATLAEGCPANVPVEQFVFMRAATWPDMVKSGSNPFHDSDDHPNWHYINLPLSFDNKPRKDPSGGWNGKSAPTNVIEAIAKADADLASARATDAERATTLSWMLHLVGDTHQPLHATSMFAAGFPNGDRGGNDFWVSNNGTITNLHALWDGLPGSTQDGRSVQGKARGLVGMAGMSRTDMARDLKVTDPMDWARESRVIAKEVAYGDGKVQGVKGDGKKGPGEAPALPSDYMKNASEVADKRVVVAGYRLADRLNNAFARSTK